MMPELTLLAALGLPWYGWLLVFLIVVIFGLWRVNRAFQWLVRAEFIDILHAKHPDWNVTAETAEYVEVERPNPKNPAEPIKGQLFLFRVYDAAASVKDQTPEGRRETLEKFADLSLMDALGKVRLETHRDHILPRIVNEAALQELSGINATPSQPLGDTGLHVVCVVDGDVHVAFFTQDMLESLALDFSTIKEHALDNLAKRFDHKSVRKAVMQKEVTLIETGDSYDAARLLLVPRHLIPGETLVAMIPDRDTLVLSPLSPNGDWKPFEQLAKSPRSDRVICNRPLIVTSQGVRAV